jgi:DNA-binding response OmpR family regulator
VQVLICDDEPSIRMLFRTAAEQCGAEVVEAVDGDDCLVKAWMARPDFVILDMVMPRRDGLSTLPALHEMFPGTTVILTSALDSVDLVAQGRAWGASECIEKLKLLPLLPALLAEAAVAV